MNTTPDEWSALSQKEVELKTMLVSHSRMAGTCGINSSPRPEHKWQNGSEPRRGRESCQAILGHTPARPELPVKQAQKKWSMEIHQICGDVFGSGPKKDRPKVSGITRLLEERARLLRVECKKGSLSSVASGLLAWHAFATDILGYSESETFPPKQDVDVCKFVAIFKNPGTAANYIGYVKWACTHFSMVTGWYSPTVTLTLKGMRAEHLRATGGPALAKVLLTDEWEERVSNTPNDAERDLRSCVQQCLKKANQTQEGQRAPPDPEMTSTASRSASSAA